MEGYSRKPPRKQLRLIPDQWALSQAILKYPQSCDEKRVSLVSKSISQVDVVGEQFKSIDSLHLSGNAIKDLTNIAQFFRLRSLSLAGNQVEQVVQLLPLKGLIRLENLNLEGNPVCLLPGYREFLISKLPSLRSLDGKEITSQERDKSKSLTDQIEGMEELAVINEEQVSRLQHLLKTLKLHKQLILTRGVENYSGVDVRLYTQWLRPAWPELLRQQVKIGLQAKVREIVGDHMDEGSLVGAYSDCVQTQQELIARISAACDDQAKACKTLWTQPREKLKPKKPPTPSARPVPPQSSSFKAGDAGVVKKDYSDVQTRYHSLIHPKRSLSNTSSRSNSILKVSKDAFSMELEERPQQLRAPVQDHEKPRKWSEAEEETIKLAEQNKALREKLKEFEQTNHDNVLMAENELRRLNERLQTAISENEQLKEKEKEAADMIESLSAVHSHLEDRYSRLVYTAEEQSSIHSTIEEGLSLVIGKFKTTKLLQRVMRVWVQATDKAVVISEFEEEGRRKRDTEVVMLCLAAWKWLAKTSKYVQFKAEQRAESLTISIIQSWKAYTEQRKGLFVLTTARKESLLRLSFQAIADFPALQQDRNAEKRVADKMCEMHRLFSSFNSWKRAIEYVHLSLFEESHLSRTAEINNRMRLLRGVWGSWTLWRQQFGIPQRKTSLVAYSHYADSLRYRMLNLLITNLKRSRQMTLSAHAMARMKLQRTLVKCAKAFKKFVLIRRIAKTVEARADRFHGKVIIRKLKIAVNEQRLKRDKEETAVSHYFKYLLRKMFRGYQQFADKKKVLLRNFASFQQSQQSLRIRHVVDTWLIALWRDSRKLVNVRARRILASWYRFALKKRVTKLKVSLANRMFVGKFQSGLRAILSSWASIKRQKVKIASTKDGIHRAVVHRLLSKCFTLWRDCYSRAILSRVQVNMTTLAQAESTLMEQSLKVRELGDTNEVLKRQLIEAEEKLKDLLEARGSLEGQLRNVQKGDNEAALLISKLERDFATAAGTIRQLQREKETLTRNYEGQVSTLKDELRTRERELAAAEQALVGASDFRREIADSTDEHVQEVVSTNDQLMAQVEEKGRELEKAWRQNEALVEKLKRSEARVTELEEQTVSVSRYPVLLSPPRKEVQQRSQRSYFESDSEPVRLPSPDEDQIREQLLTLKQERVAIREEIESRMKRVDGKQRVPASRTGSDSGLLDISSRMASLEARLASKLK